MSHLPVIEIPYQSPSLLVLLLLAVSLVLYSFLVAIYRLTFHPLAKYPGPPLAKISNLYSAYHSLRGDLHSDIYRCHERYGPFVRYGPNRLAVNTPEGLHDIYHSNKNVKKAGAYIPLQWNPHTTNTISCRDKHEATSRRKALGRGFSNSSVQEFQVLLSSQVEQLCQLLQKEAEGSNQEWSKPLNMAEVCNWFTLDVIGEFGFGRNFNLLSSPDNRFIREVIEGSLIRTNILVQFPFLLNTGMEMLLYPKGLRKGAKFLALCRKYLNQAIGSKTYNNDLISHVLRGKKCTTNQPLNSEEIWEEAKFIVAAGSETSAVALSTIFYHLTRNPSAYSKAAHEVRTALSSPALSSSKPNLPYLQACITESLRLSPPTPICLWREVEPQGGCVIDNELIPAGTDVGVGIYAIHHNPSVFPDPFAFRPERWIETQNTEENPSTCGNSGSGSADTAEGVEASPSFSGSSDPLAYANLERAKKAYCPFSIGPRACPAKALALRELEAVMVDVMLRFDFRKAEGGLGKVGERRVDVAQGSDTSGGKGGEEVIELNLWSHLTTTIEGPWVEFRRR